MTREVSILSGHKHRGRPHPPWLPTLSDTARKCLIHKPYIRALSIHVALITLRNMSSSKNGGNLLPLYTPPCPPPYTQFPSVPTPAAVRMSGPRAVNGTGAYVLGVGTSLAHKLITLSEPFSSRLLTVSVTNREPDHSLRRTLLKFLSGLIVTIVLCIVLGLVLSGKIH